MISILGFEIRRKRKFGYEYWIKLSDIKISEDFKKYIEKYEYELRCFEIGNQLLEDRKDI